MISAPPRPDEAASLAALRALDVLDSESEAPFDALVKAAAAVCGTPISLISLVDAERQWFKANLGLPGVTETPRDLAFCAHAVLGDDLFEVPDARDDERFHDNPLVTEAPHIRFYVGMPVRIGDGPALGTLCVIDRQPRQLDDRQREVLRQLGQAAAQMLDGRRALRRLERKNRMLQEAQRVGGIGSWTWVVGAPRIHGSAALNSLVGRDSAAGPATLSEHLKIYTESSRIELQQAVDHALAHGVGFRLELNFTRPDGSPGWVDSRAEVDVDDKGRVVRLHGTLQDITTRKTAELDASKAHQILRAAVDALDEAFVLYDPEDRLVMCNERYRTLYATSRDLLVPGATFESIIREGARRGQYQAAHGRVEEWVAERMAAHRSGNATLIQRLDDGRTLRIVERRMPDGHLVGFRIDITDLVRATEAAEESSRAKSDFIATMSHELRTPLQSIIGFSELGQQMTRNEGQDRYASMFGKVLRGGQRMLSLVNDLLDLSAIDSVTLALSRRREDLRVLAQGVCDELTPLAQARSVTVELAASMPPLPVDADAGRLQQVIRNVLANAIRFAPPGSVVAIDGAIDGAGAGHRGVELTVRDHGPGIPPEELELVFDAFVQSSRTRDGSGGSGLGLTICRRIMAAHGGTITAENVAPTGTLLRLHLPVGGLPLEWARPTATLLTSAPAPSPAPARSESAA